MYLRFEPETVDPNSNYIWSVFGALGHLLETGTLTDYEFSRLQELDDWFTTNLQEPTRLARSRKNDAEKKAVCWFKADASECIANLREIVSVLNNHDLTIRMLKSTNPGYVVYEDKYQIAAIPFHKT
ncbi:hypothetical protein Pla144_08630 [Bythopirellula polymerisocia]|uniref:Uncharacterized protein n=1 Tax=Bythopirellula polymerisocia TaxID=2528003 RepID=A0A5C6D349_9BACT|nr:hypothetical protein Pla144_08630 [Bythopirellula polymerisocia]